MPRLTRSARSAASRRHMILCAAATGLVSSAVYAANPDIIGATALHALDPTLTGAGVQVAQPEASLAGGTNLFEVNPTNVGQPASLFTYTDDSGNVTTAFNPAFSSGHADLVGKNYYGAGTGVAQGVSHVDNYNADYFYNTIVTNLTPIADAVVNQSFIFNEDPSTRLTVADQQTTDSTYDAYIYKFGTIFLSAAGNGPPPFGTVNAAATSYNSIGVGDSDGATSVGPTADNGRSKPDITAPGGATSFSTPLVAGSAAILLQAGARGDGGSGTETDATDARTVKALLLNGAVKPAGWTHTTTAPLDAHYGAGVLNILNSYQQLVGGEHHSGSSVATATVGGIHPAVNTGTINSLQGWDAATLTSTRATDTYNNYDFALAAGGGVTSYTLTATLVWERQGATDVGNPINRLDLYLFDATHDVATPIDMSVSAVDNVQQLYTLNLTPGDTYDLEVLKNGGVVGSAGVVSDAEQYSLAYSFTAVPEPGMIGLVSLGGLALLRRRVQKN